MSDANDSQATSSFESSASAIEIEPAAVIEFPDGLIGLGGQRFTLLATTPAPDSAVRLAALTRRARTRVAGHQPAPLLRRTSAWSCSRTMRERMGIDGSVSVDVYVTVRAAPRLTDFVANLRAPIVVHRGRGAQVINQAPGMRTARPAVPAGDPGGRRRRSLTASAIAGTIGSSNAEDHPPRRRAHHRRRRHHRHGAGGLRPDRTNRDRRAAQRCGSFARRSGSRSSARTKPPRGRPPGRHCPMCRRTPRSRRPPRPGTCRSSRPPASDYAAARAASSRRPSSEAGVNVGATPAPARSRAL